MSSFSQQRQILGKFMIRLHWQKIKLCVLRITNCNPCSVDCACCHVHVTSNKRHLRMFKILPRFTTQSSALSCCSVAKFRFSDISGMPHYELLWFVATQRLTKAWKLLAIRVSVAVNGSGHSLRVRHWTVQTLTRRMTDYMTVNIPTNGSKKVEQDEEKLTGR